MKSRVLILALALGVAVCSVATALDTIKKTQGTVTGRIKGMTPKDVTIDIGGAETSVPVNEIATIYYEGEPTAVKTARTNLLNGAYENAVEALDRVSPEDLSRDIIKQEVDYFKAVCAAKLALGGSGSVKDAGSKMVAFTRAYPNSYHYLEACEILGDLLVSIGSFGPAESYYSKLAAAPWPAYKMRAGVKLGRAQLAQNKPADAMRTFDAVLGIKADDDAAKIQRLAATLGKASCMAAEGKQEEAITMITKILQDADPEDTELHSRAYNTLGTALRKAGRDKEALLAFLHVDLLYFSQPEAHAEALYNLADLWNQLHKTERAVRARKLLQENYANSTWARKGQ